MALTLARSPDSKANELADAKASAISEVNALIGAAREKYITALPGQESIYAAKEAEARAYLAASPAPADLTGYPYLAAEVGITAPDADSLAQLWVQMAEQWKMVGSQLEQLRIGYINDVRQAPDKATITALVEELKNTLEAF